MKKKILIIEDEETVRNNIRVLLEEEGYEVYTAINGDLGIKAAKKNLPNLIICDIMMPIMDGYKVLSELSKYPNTHYIPFIFLSAKVELTNLRKGMGLGADDYIFKPFKSNNLLNAIETRLKKYDRIKGKVISDFSKNGSEQNPTYTIDETIFFNINGKSKFIKINLIKYISAENQYSKINMTNGSHFLLKKSLASWNKVLPSNHFVQIHRSTIINVNFIDNSEKKTSSSHKIFLKDHNGHFTISKRYSTKLKTKL